MNPFQFAVANVKKKAQELFNNSAPVQGARMYGQAFQSPAVQKFANNAGNYLNKGLQQVSRQPLYNIPNSPTYGQLGNTLKGYATNQVIKPIVEGSFQYNKPNATLLDKGSGFLKAGMGVMNATPQGFGFNSVFNPTAGVALAIRTKQPLQKGIEKGLTTQMSLGSEGLGIKNPLLAGAVDLVAGIKTYDPYHAGSLKGVAALEEGVSKVKGNVLHSDDIQEIVNMTKRLRGGWKDARGMVNLEQLGKDTNLADIILADKYKVPATELKKMDITDKIRKLERIAAEDFRQNPSIKLQGAESSIKLPVEPKIKIVNGKVKVKMKPISVPTQESLVSQSSNQGLAGSGAGGGSSIKNTKEFVNPQDPYFNVSRLNVSNKKQQAVKAVIEESKPQIEQVVGKKLSNKEVIDFSNQSAKVLNRAVNREQTKQWSASMLKAREQLAKAAHDDSLTPEFLDTLINVKSQGADIARKLQSLSINADPKTVTAKQAILEAVLKVTDNSDEILQAARGVNFNDQAQATAFYRQFVKPKAEDWLTLIRYNSMLSSPNTHIINTSSNLQGTGLVAPIEKTILGGIDWMRSKATGTSRRYYAGEGGEYAKGYYSSLAEASKNFTKVMRGEALSGNPDIRQLPLTTKKGMARVAENVLNYPMRLLEGMDQFFGTLTQAGVERSLNYRASKGVNVGNIAYKAEQEAANRLFRGEIGGKDQGTLLRAIDQVTNLVFRARSNENPIVRTIAQFTLPFVKTPMNIVKQMVEYSPAGVLTIPGAKFKQEQLAKAVMGAGVALGASQLLSSDRLTWSEPTNEKQRNAFKASGLQPYAIKIGDKWVSYAKLHPVIGFNLAMVAALNDSFKNKKLSESEVETALTGLSKWWGYFADQSYIKNMGDLVASARGDLTGTARLISNYPTQVIPFRALMSWVERLVDPYQRQADPDGSILEKQLQIIGSQIPGIAGNVPTRKNLYGEPIENQNRLINAFSPAKITTENPQQKAVYDDMVNTSIMKKQIKDMQDQAKKGNVVSGGTSTGMPSSMQMDIQEEGIKNNLKYSNKYVESIGGKLYIKQQDGSVKVISLGSSKPTGNIIQQAKQQTNKESAIKSAGVSTYFRTDMPDAEKLQVYKALGTNASDVEMKALSSLEDNQQASVLYSLLKDRQWKQEKVDAFIKSDVLTNSVVSKMEQQGLINSNQATQLKNYIKSINVKFGKAKASKPKKLKIPKLKKISVKKTKLKIKLPKAPTAKLLKPRGGSRKYFS